VALLLREKEGEKGKEREWRGWEGSAGDAPNANSWIHPWKYLNPKHSLAIQFRYCVYVMHIVFTVSSCGLINFKINKINK